MTASVLTIGDELLIGQVVDTNAAWLGEVLSSHGFSMRTSATVGDDSEAIQTALRQALSVSEAVLCTGGLGATQDDLTRRAVAAALGLPLEHHEETMDRVRSYHERRERALPEAASHLAEVPQGFEVVENPIGIAPALWFRGEIEAMGMRAIALLPGVPREMRALVSESILPRLLEGGGASVAAHKTISTVGLGESAVEERLGDLEEWRSAGQRIAFLPDYGVVRVRLTALGAVRAEAEERLDAFEAHVREKLGDLVFGEGKTTLSEAVGAMLRETGLSLSIAESCTGGRVGDAITDVPGSSDYFAGGVVAYSNRIKVDLLGVDPATLGSHGAVSEQVAVQMALGARRLFRAEIGLGTTGVAGPRGGTPNTPVGTVWIAFASSETVHAARLSLAGDRDTIKQLTVNAALNLVRRQLLRLQHEARLA